MVSTGKPAAQSLRNCTAQVIVAKIQLVMDFGVPGGERWGGGGGGGGGGGAMLFGIIKSTLIWG